MRVGTDTGKFTGSSETSHQLKADGVYHCRVRQQSDTAQWSAWNPGTNHSLQVSELHRWSAEGNESLLLLRRSL